MNLKNTNTLIISTLLISLASIAISVSAFIENHSLRQTITDNSEANTSLISLNATNIEDMKTTKEDESPSELKEFIMDNPEAIIKSLAKYRFTKEQESKQVEKLKIKEFTAALEDDPLDPIIGNPNGKHVVVEFADNNCGYCKSLAPILKEFIDIDPEAKVIIKEYPIFDTRPSSRYSALVGTAIWLSDPSKYKEFHEKVMGTKMLTNEAVDAYVGQVGLTLESITPHFETASKQLEKNHTLAAQLKVTGTPTMFVLGDKLHGGFTAQGLSDMFK